MAMKSELIMGVPRNLPNKSECLDTAVACLIDVVFSLNQRLELRGNRRKRSGLYPTQECLYPTQECLYPSQDCLYPTQESLYPTQDWRSGSSKEKELIENIRSIQKHFQSHLAENSGKDVSKLVEEIQTFRTKLEEEQIEPSERSVNLAKTCLNVQSLLFEAVEYIVAFIKKLGCIVKKRCLELHLKTFRSKMESNQTEFPKPLSKSSSFTSRLDIVPGLTVDKDYMEPDRIVKCAKIVPPALEQMPIKQLERGEIVFKSRKRYLNPGTGFNVQQKKRIRTKFLRNIPPEKSVGRSLRSFSVPLTPSIMSMNTSSTNSSDIPSKWLLLQTKSENNITKACQEQEQVLVLGVLEQVLVSEGEEQVLVSEGEEQEQVLVPGEEEQVLVSKGEEQVLISEGEDQVLVFKGEEQVLVSKGEEQVLVSKGEEQVLVSEGEEQVLGSKGAEQVLISKGEEQVLVSKGEEQVLVFKGEEQVLVSEGEEQVLVPGGEEQVLVPGGEEQILVSEGGVQVLVPEIQEQVPIPEKFNNFLVPEVPILGVKDQALVRKFELAEPCRVLRLLEKKRKVAKKNGLHQFVLWRAAYNCVREKARSNAEQRFARRRLGARIGSSLPLGAGPWIGTLSSGSGTRIGTSSSGPGNRIGTSSSGLGTRIGTLTAGLGTRIGTSNSDKRSINAKTRVKKSSEDPGAPGSLLIRASPGLPGAQRVVEYWNLENISWSLLFLNCFLIYHILLIDISCSVK